MPWDEDLEEHLWFLVKVAYFLSILTTLLRIEGYPGPFHEGSSGLFTFSR